MLRRIFRSAPPSPRRCRSPQPWNLLGEYPTLPSVNNSRWLSSSSRNNRGNEGEARDLMAGKPPVISLCQMNNHPDFRLREARARVAHDLAKGGAAKSAKDVVHPKFKRRMKNKPVKEKGISIHAHQNPTRSNDGTSSGALTADRLRNARVKALENMAESPPTEQLAQINASLQPIADPSARSVKEHGVSVQISENPIRSNDGTSSGALAADRLRQARRKAIENMQTQLPLTQMALTETSPPTPSGPSARSVKEQGVSVQISENPIRSNDGTSSGALAADRLRQARRKAIENMQ